MEEDKTIENQEEGAGAEPLKKKREKKRKPQEEKLRDRRMILIVFVIVLLTTLVFYYWPRITGIVEGERSWKIEMPVWKTYTEVEM